jgi:hypothetical protein
VGGYAPRAPEEIVRPRRLVGASGRPLNFTVRARHPRLILKVMKRWELEPRTLRQAFPVRGGQSYVLAGTTHPAFVHCITSSARAQ